MEEAAESVKKAEGEYAAARKNAGTWSLMAKLVPVIGVLAAGGMAVLALARGDAVSFPAVLTGVLFLVFTLALGVFNHSQARRSRAWGDQVLLTRPPSRCAWCGRGYRTGRPGGRTAGRTCLTLSTPSPPR